MTDQEIHFALQEESDSTLPKSGFLDSVMAEIEAEAVRRPLSLSLGDEHCVGSAGSRSSSLPF